MLCAKCGRQLNAVVCSSCGYDHTAQEVLYLTVLCDTQLPVEEIVTYEEVAEAVSEALQMCDVNADFEIKDGVLVKYRGDAREVVVPRTVREIGGAAFRHCDFLERLRLESGIQKIGHRAFANCSSLKSVRIPGSVTVIGQGAFENCSALESVVLEHGVQEIQTNAFWQCGRLRFVVIPRSVNRIGEGVFSNSPGKIVVEEGVDQAVLRRLRARERRVNVFPSGVRISCSDAQYGCGSITVQAPLHWRLVNKSLVRELERND